MMEKAMFTTHDMLREPRPIFLTDFLRSDKSDTVSLPFKLIIEQSHQSTKRNMPYLRQSWNRIDFLSILCFWVSFGLATGGVEKGSTLYIGIFRALSVLKVSRLLAVTSGTTVRTERLLPGSITQLCSDYNAFLKDRSPSTDQCGLLRLVCNASVFVRRPILSRCPDFNTI